MKNKLSHISKYFTELKETFGAGTATEHSYRPALKSLIESLKRGILAQNEPKRVKAGAPDFVITQKKLPLGYIEAKDIGVDLDKTEKSEQLKRYLTQLSGRRNIILTDYLEFRWYVDGDLQSSARIGGVSSKKKLDFDESGAQGTLGILQDFLRQPPIPVGTSLELARRMADSAKVIRNSIISAFAHEDRGGSLHEQMEGFRDVLLHDLEAKQFADMYAQTICYGLFAARVNHNESEPFTRKTAGFSIPKTNPFLGKMYEYIAGTRLDERITWAVDDLAELLAHANMSAVLEDFGKRTLREDPVVHFYETFLAEYDPKMREARGVYYTPEPVVSYIVRSVDQIIKRDFGLIDGLADKSKIPLIVTEPDKSGKPKQVKKGDTHKTLILDPACGTGTFLHHVIEVIRDHETRAKRKAAWPSYVRDHLLPRLIGFELLMAPYAVAHMKLGMQLKDSGYKFDSKERLGVFLTNTLEEAFRHEKLSLFGDVIAKEAEAAREVKVEKPVMVILGNPPYSGLSANMSPKMAKIVEPYKFVDGKPLGERKHWLQDDYVKFIRFAQAKIEDTGYGVLAFISNHGYLDNPTFRGMRQSLMKTFDKMYFLDLHGNLKKKEKAPDGGPDKNVFAIQQGVAVGVFVKLPEALEAPEINHAEIFGLQKEKYEWLESNDLDTCEWERLKPKSETYFFVPKDTLNQEEYELGWQVTDILATHTTGIVTARDSFVIDFDDKSIATKLDVFLNEEHSDTDVKNRLGLSENYMWRVSEARNQLRKVSNISELYTDILYRPFDSRRIILHGSVVWRTRSQVMRHMLAGDNLALSTTRSIEIGRGWEHVFCTDQVIQHHTVSIKEVNYLFPLYLYPESKKGDLFAEHESTERKPNLSAEFIKDFSTKLKLKFITDAEGDCKKTFGPEDVFHYIYAIFHSPKYRSRYAEFLKIDFPRVPLTTKTKLFKELCKLGAGLVESHLLKNQLATPPLCGLEITGDNVVEKVRYTPPDKEIPAGRVWFNDEQYIEGVPPEVWEFHVGGYQVCNKWLKDRKGRALSSDDIEHYQIIVESLSETIRLMADIDSAIDKQGGWPIM